MKLKKWVKKQRGVGRKTGTLSLPSFSPGPSSEDRDTAGVLALPDSEHSPLSAPGIVLKILFFMLPMMTCRRWVELKTTGQTVKRYSVCLSSFTWKEPSLRDYTGNRLEDWGGAGQVQATSNALMDYRRFDLSD